MTADSHHALFHLIYVSEATRLLSATELGWLVDVSRIRNTRSGITGTLIYRDGCFLQEIEGPESAVQRLFNAIARDPRHGAVHTLAAQPVTERAYPLTPLRFSDHLHEPALYAPHTRRIMDAIRVSPNPISIHMAAVLRREHLAIRRSDPSRRLSA